MTPTQRPASRLPFAVSAAGCAALVAGLLIAQPIPAPNNKTEVEETAKSKPKKPALRDDTEPGTTPKPPEERPPADGVIDLAEQAALSSHPEVKALLKRLAEPYDLITLKTGKEHRVGPIPRYLGNVQPYPAAMGEVRAHEMGKDGRPLGVETIFKANDVKFVDHYENILLREAKNVLERGYEKLTKDAPGYMSKGDQLEIAWMLRTVAARSVAAGIGARQRAGDGWDELRKEAQKAAGQAKIDRLRALGADNDPRAEALAKELNETEKLNYAVVREVQLWQLGRWAGRLAIADDEELAAIRGRLDHLESIFPGGLDDAITPQVRAVREQLRRRATKLFADAKGKTGAEATALLELAARLDPNLDGLQRFRLQQAKDYPTLTVAMPTLPTRMSPHAARTDADRAAVDLVFESLVRPLPSTMVGVDYRPGLAALPRVVPMGREFDLQAGAVWADGDKVRSARAVDAFQTLQRLNAQEVRPEFLDAIDFGRLTVDSPTQLRLNFRRGLFEPLAWLDFKVLPDSFLKQGKPLDDAEFAAHPVGTGPYRFVSTDGKTVTFQFNPSFASRAGREGRPRVREVRFVKAEPDLKDRLKKGDVDLVVGVPTERLPELLDAKVQPPDGPARFTNLTAHRRIHLLAVNARKEPLTKEAIRRAISYAIDREAALDEVYRAKKVRLPNVVGQGLPPVEGGEYHHPLTGPFPPHAVWANHPDPEPDAPTKTANRLFNKDKARSLLTAAGYSKDRPLTLRLLYARNGDPHDALAAEALKLQLDEAGIGLKVLPEGSDDLTAVLRQGDYDLAYTTHDYANHLYSLAGLLGSGQVGKSNYLGFSDPECDRVLGQVRDHRDFKELQDRTRYLHKQFVQKWMPFVPLWQLDVHVIARKSVRAYPDFKQLDALHPFRFIEEWETGKSD